MKTRAAPIGDLVGLRAFCPTRRPMHLVLALTTVGLIAALVQFISFQEARSQFAQELVAPKAIPQSQLYYVSYAVQIVFLVSAGILAFLSTEWRTIREGYLGRLTLLLGAALLMAARGYSFSALLSTKLLDISGPFPFFMSVLVFIGAERKNWVVLGKAMIILAALMSAMVLLSLAGLQLFTRAEGVAKLAGVLNVLFWPASWLALTDHPRDSLAGRLRFVPMVIYGCGSFFTQTRLNFVMIFAFLTVYSYVQRKRNSPQAVTWVVGLVVAVWIILLTETFLVGTRVFENISSVAADFSSRLDDDSRTGQILWFAAGVTPSELLLGRGSFATWFWRTGEYNGGTDVGYLTMLFYGGVPLLVIYIWTHVTPCLVVLRKSSADWHLAGAGVTLLWGLVMFSSAYPSTSLDYYLVLFCIGACISRGDSLTAVRSMRA